MTAAGISGGANDRVNSFPINESAEWWGKVSSVKVIYRMIDSEDDPDVGGGMIRVCTEVAKSSESK